MILYELKDNKGKKYYGITNDYSRRVREHLAGRGSSLIKQALSEGKTFVARKVFEGPEKVCLNLEERLISLYSLQPKGYNIARGGSLGGTSCRLGSSNPSAKLTDTDVITIRNLRSEYNTNELAKLFKVSRENITAICTGKSWKHVGGPITKAYRGKKLSNTTKQEILNLRNSGLTFQQIANKLGISVYTAHKYGRI